MSQAHLIVEHSLIDHEGGLKFSRDRAFELLSLARGVEFYNSNDSERGVSFAPTIRAGFADGSVIEIGYSCAEVLRGAARDD